MYLTGCIVPKNDEGAGSIVGDALKWLVQQSVGAVLTAIILIFAGPTIIKNVSDSLPTCERPIGLTRVSLSEADSVGGNWSPPPSESYPDDFYHPVRAFDQNLGTVWALPRSSAQSGRDNGFLLDLAEARDVELVCAVNGAPVDPNSYQRADRVREASVSFVCSGSRRTQRVYMQSRPDTDMQLPQQIGSRCPSMTSLSVHVTSSYEGWDVTRLGSDHVEKATERIALADIVLYAWGSDLNLSQRVARATGRVVG